MRTIEGALGMARSRLRRESGLLRSVARLLGSRDRTLELKSHVESLEHRSRETASRRDRLRRELQDVWDYWLDYPPDWERRREEALGGGRGCRRCGDVRGSMHVHHLTPISRGGSHRPENLTVLCATCHSNAHGGRDFEKHHRTGPTAFARKVSVLQQALADSGAVSFNYTSREGEHTSRTVTPLAFSMVGKTLCLRAFCQLRRAERTFAVKRMAQVRRA